MEERFFSTENRTPAGVMVALVPSSSGPSTPPDCIVDSTGNTTACVDNNPTTPSNTFSVDVDSVRTITFPTVGATTLVAHPTTSLMVVDAGTDGGSLIFINGGAENGTGLSGGTLFLTSGVGNTTGDSGGISMSTPNAISVGVPFQDGQSGNIAIITGTADGDNLQRSGDIRLVTGDVGIAGEVATGQTGSIVLITGTSRNGAGVTTGGIGIQTGDQETDNAFTGDVRIGTGDATSLVAGSAGDVMITPGTGVTRNGRLCINNLLTFANDAAAGLAGLAQNDIYINNSNAPDLFLGIKS